MTEYPIMMSLRLASQMTGLPYEFIRELCIQKKIVFIRSGKKYFVNRDKLISFLNEGDMDE